MGRYNQIDMSFSEEGDFILTEDNDFAISTGEECLREDISIRAKTERGSWLIYSLLGASLQNLIGRSNSRQTAEEGEANLKRNLTYDNLIDSSGLQILYLPVKDSILYYITVKTDSSRELSIAANLDLHSGIGVI